MSEPATPPVRTLPPWWAVLLVALGVAALAFAIGRFSTFGSGAPATPGTTSPEAGFARDMQVHHGQAVEMAMDIYRTTSDEDIRVLAYDIATTQSAQKGEFYDWLVKWGLPQAGGPLMAWMTDADAGHNHGAASSGADATAPTEAELMTQMGMASAEELAAMRAATGTEADCMFLSLMIRHHEGAIPMAQALLQLGSDPRALTVAQGVIDTQSAEIDLMTSLQNGLACG
ncbi:DUF305 domain-containing protein [uncultured Microbacterium sp.]|uniref:DUF305 domain-containing protein n=1 Tax=uncultured Microbacterium sp. TaxID=191216 RepID=UPI002603591A|nr:DUF305 domain-containing protein [uncultured Microbacterium sp.]